MESKSFEVGNKVVYIGDSIPDRIFYRGSVVDIDHDVCLTPIRVAFDNNSGEYWIAESELANLTPDIPEEKTPMAGDRFTYKGNRISNHHNRSGTIKEIDSGGWIFPLKVQFDGDLVTYCVSANEIKIFPDARRDPQQILLVKERKGYIKDYIPNSPMVGELTISGAFYSAQIIRFRASQKALRDAYAATFHKEWAASCYQHTVSVQYIGNATIVTVMIDSLHDMTPDTRAFRVFGGVAICNASDIFDALIGLKTALRDALDVGKRTHWRNEHVSPVQAEEWHILRVMLNQIECRGVGTLARKDS